MVLYFMKLDKQYNLLIQNWDNNTDNAVYIPNMTGITMQFIYLTNMTGITIQFIYLT